MFTSWQSDGLYRVWLESVTVENNMLIPDEAMEDRGTLGDIDYVLTTL